MFGTGWRPDPPDDRDLTFGDDHVQEMLSGLGIHRIAKKLLPKTIDLRPWCSPIQFQGYYNTCTAHVVAGMIELLETRATGYFVPASRLFLYQVAKRILGETGDPGVYLRQMMGSVVLLGVPPEKYWPYLDTKVKDDPRIDAQPDAFCFALAREYGTARYFRLDSSRLDPQQLLTRMKACLAASMPSSLGFTLYMSSLKYASTTGEMLFPLEGEKPVGSHAILVIGYDDAKTMPVSAAEGEEPTEETKGAFLFKNSWGDTWGDSGYGWLPYRYLLDGLAKDCWTMMQARWVETDQFQLDLEEKSPNDPDAKTGSIADGPIGETVERIHARVEDAHSKLESRRRASSTRSRSKPPSSQNDKKVR
jgi:C1A family cysteine protease